MAFNDYESTRDRAQPVELYEFVYGEAGQAHRYTDAETEVSYSGDTYLPVPIARSKVESKSGPGNRELTVRVPLNTSIAELFKVFPPGRVVSLKIRQGHVPNPDDPASFATGENFPVMWVGRVLEASRSGAECTLTCDSVSTGMDRPGLRRHYQWPCPLVLYGPACGVDRAAGQVTAAAVSVTGNRVVLSSGWNGTQPTKDFAGGLAEWTTPDGTESRAVIKIEDPDTLVLRGPPSGVSAGTPVDVFLGCPRTLDACENLHNNVVRYGGHPWIPTLNPVHRNNHT